MKKQRLKWVVGTALIAMGAGQAHAAIQIAGDKLEVAGRVHFSADLSDTDGQPADGTEEGTNFSVSSNSSYLRFAGRQPLDTSWTLQWQIEQGYRGDAGGGNWASRNTYLGIMHERYGTLRIGYYDTPYKTMSKRWAVLSDTVADRRAILGAGAESANVMNVRAANSVIYMNKVDALEFELMYAAQGQSGRDGGVDDNDNAALSGAVWYTIGPLELSGALEHWFGFNTPNAPAADDRVTGLRLAARHAIGANGSAGVIFETIDTSGAELAELDRNVIGVNGSYRFGKNRIDAQLLFAGNRRGLGDSGAINLGLGITHQFDRQVEVYAAASITDNERNARYKATDGGHGDEVGTDFGGTPRSISAGLVYRF
jgi:predicted porin